MPLNPQSSIRSNVKELMGKVESSSRKKAINTIAKERGVTKEEAKFIQAKAIAVSLFRKK